MKSENKTEQYRLRMTKEERECLDMIASYRGISKSAILLKMIKEEVGRIQKEKLESEYLSNGFRK